MNRTAKIVAVLVALVMGITLAACSTKATTVNKNLDKQAESFQVFREISFINGITDKEMLHVRGYCSIEYGARKYDVTCKVPGGYVRNTMTKSDNSFVVSEQKAASDVSDTHYKLIIRPGTAIPAIDLQ